MNNLISNFEEIAYLEDNFSKKRAYHNAIMTLNPLDHQIYSRNIPKPGFRIYDYKPKINYKIKNQIIMYEEIKNALLERGCSEQVAMVLAQQIDDVSPWVIKEILDELL